VWVIRKVNGVQQRVKVSIEDRLREVARDSGQKLVKLDLIRPQVRQHVREANRTIALIGETADQIGGCLGDDSSADEHYSIKQK